jgi:protocatechuate 4,5-dioxygenase alpha chain
MPISNEYEDIPGTVVFDSQRARQGYHLNMFCMSLLKADNRAAFKENEEKYLDRFPMTPEQREAVLKRQWNRMLELGGNIYFTAKLGATDGLSFQQVAAMMTGSTQQEYADGLAHLAGGDCINAWTYGPRWGATSSWREPTDPIVYAKPLNENWSLLNDSERWSRRRRRDSILFTSAPHQRTATTRRPGRQPQ